MNRLGKRIERLETSMENANQSPVNIIFIRFVSPEDAKGGHSRLGLAIPCRGQGGRLFREEDEREDDFLMRAYMAVAPEGPPEKLRGDDLVTFLAARDPTIARADYEKHPITDDMLQRAITATGEIQKEKS